MLSSLLAALTIAALRSIDVSLGTVRVVSAVEGRRLLASMIGFVEALTFIIAASIVFRDLKDPLRIVGYATGFSIGTALGVTLVRSLKLGAVTVRIILPAGPLGLAEELRRHGYALTVFDGQGRDGPIRMIMAVVRKKQLDDFLSLTQPYLGRCFVTVGEEPLQEATFPGAAALRK